MTRHTQAKVRRIKLVRTYAPCFRCGTMSSRHSRGTRTINDLGITTPVKIVVTYSKHYCPTCRKYFSIDMSHIAEPGSKTLIQVSNVMRFKYFVILPHTTLYDWIADAELNEIEERRLIACQ